MSAKKSRSKKRSVASSKRQRSEITIFLDRNLGKHVVAEALRAVGVVFELHDDHLALDAPDEAWIALVSRKGWLAITKDKNIRYRTAEIDAIKKHRAKVLVVRAKNTTGTEIADILIGARKKIQAFASTYRGPFVAGIDRTGRITRYEI